METGKLIERKDLVVGEIYYAPTTKNIFCWEGHDSAYYVGGSRNEYHRGQGGFGHGSAEATPFEKAWLHEMNRIGIFIPEDKFKEKFNQTSETYSIY